MVGGVFGMLLLSAPFKISCLMGRHHMKGGSECHFNGPVIPFGAGVEYHSVCAKDTSRSHQFGPQVLPRILFGYVFYAGWNQESGHYDRRHWRIGGDGRIRTPRPKAQSKKWKLHVPSRRWISQNLWERTASENTHLNPGSSGRKRRTRSFSRRIRKTLFCDHRRIHLSS